MHALITGGAGFVGRYLIDELLRHRWRVTAVSQEAADLGSRVRFLRMDVRDMRPALLRRIRPDIVFHLAAVSNVPAAQSAPRLTFEINTLGSAALLRSVEDSDVRARFVLVSSADVYAPSASPLTETSPLRPFHPYSASKICAEALARAGASRGADVLLLRPFNHTGPGQSTGFVAPAFAEQIARAEAGLAPPIIRVGDLDPVRDFSDVRDVVRAYRLAAERAESGTLYNISSDRGVRIRELLDRLLSLSMRRLRVVRDRSRSRRDPRSRRVGCSAPFRRRTGWSPQIPLEKTLEDLLAYHRARVRATIRNG